MTRLQESTLPHQDRLRETDVEAREDQSTNVARLILTEQTVPDLGPIAYTAETLGPDGQLLERSHDYPLHPGALQRIQADWQARARALGAHFEQARPGRVLTAPDAPGQLRGERPAGA